MIPRTLREVSLVALYVAIALWAVSRALIPYPAWSYYILGAVMIVAMFLLLLDHVQHPIPVLEEELTSERIPVHRPLDYSVHTKEPWEAPTFTKGRVKDLTRRGGHNVQS